MFRICLEFDKQCFVIGICLVDVIIHIKFM